MGTEDARHLTIKMREARPGQARAHIGGGSGSDDNLNQAHRYHLGN
ncbi:MAG: hypothetical protein H6650_16085 [Ardenticatenales bacterium]|nr:hypothetical protein [Ardenticatenales bacterium]